MHASNGPPCFAKPQVRLDGQKVDSVLRELPGAPCSQKAPAIILMRTWIYHPRPFDAGLHETHSVAILQLRELIHRCPLASFTLKVKVLSIGRGLETFAEVPRRSGRLTHSETSNRTGRPRMAPDPHIPMPTPVSKQDRLPGSPSSHAP